VSGQQKSEEAESHPRPPGRLRAAWRVLRGEALVPAQILAEWVEYQLIFDDLLSRMSVTLARQAKAERKRLRRLQDEGSPDPSSNPQLQLLPSGSTPKSQLRSLAAARMGLGPLQARLHQQPPSEPQPQESAK